MSSYKKSNELHNYDVYPKVFPADSTQTVTLMPLGAHASFGQEAYTVQVCPLEDGTPWDYHGMHGWTEYEDVKVCEDGSIRFTHTFKGESEHFIRLLNEEGKKILQMSVYSVAEDLCGRYPFTGDLHMHTCRSDGRQAPAVVAANYRKIGYDFLAITDHGRYYPSLEAMNTFKDTPIEYTLIPGEEVHMPKGDADHVNDVHIVNFGGTWSVNALVADNANEKEKGSAPTVRSLYGEAPDVMSREVFFAEVDAYADTIEIPEGVDRFPYACCKWVFNHINEADGLPIFAHPYWISNVYQVPTKLSEALFNDKTFGAFEVLGGENYFEQNGFQTIFWYEQCAKGNKTPIVGSTDSHSSFNNDNAAICSTIVFAPENERKSLISSIKSGYSVAVDTISKEYRMVGEMRLVKYASFLYKNFFPLHDELCIEEGRAMKDYALGDKDALRVLEAISGRMKKQREKYFAF